MKSTIFKLFILTLLSLTALAAKAQFFNAPVPINQSLQQSLLHNLKIAKANKNDGDELRALLSLSSLHVYKYVRNEFDLAKALDYADEARTLAKKRHDFNAETDAATLHVLALFGRTEFEKAEDYINSFNDTIKIRLLHALIFQHFTLADDEPHYKKALGLAQTAIELSHRMKDRQEELLSRSWLTYLHVFDKGKDVEKNLNEIADGLSAMKSSFLYYPYYALSAYYIFKGDYAKTLKYDEMALKAVRNPSDSIALGDIYHCMGIAYKSFGKHVKALEYFKLTIYNYGLYRNPVTLTGTATLMCKTLNSLKRYQEAVDFLIENRKKYPVEFASENALYDSQIGKNYQALKKYDKAEFYLRKSYHELSAIGQTSPGDAESMAQFYVETKHFEKARPFIYAFNSGAKKSQISVIAQSHVEYLNYLVDSAAGKYKSAMLHLEKSKLLDNSYLTEKKNSEIQELDARYETKKKEDQIIQLRQKAEIERAIAKQQAIEKKVSIGGLALLMIIAILLWRQSRLRKKNNDLISKKNGILQQLLNEKEWLLKEVHHRVKNNLHTVICLLESQAAYLENDALKAIETSQHRIYAMSLIHHKLYQADDIKSIDMDVYLDEFIDYLEDSFGNQKHITILRNIEPIKLGASQAIPVGLIINETVTNAFKYAFPDRCEGTICITLKKSGDVLELSIKDNGVGMKLTPVDEESGGSLGVELIKGLSRDLNGELTRENKNGLSITIRFRINPLDGSAFNYQSAGNQVAQVG